MQLPFSPPKKKKGAGLATPPKKGQRPRRGGGAAHACAWCVAQPVGEQCGVGVGVCGWGNFGEEKRTRTPSSVFPPEPCGKSQARCHSRGQYVVGVGRGERGGGNGGGGRGTMDKGKRHNESRQQTNHNSPRGGGVSERDSRSPAEGSLSVADRKALAAAPMQRATICPSPRRPFGRLHTVHMQHMWG